jgi:hypothetical protein
MKTDRGIFLKLCVLLLAGMLASGDATAQSQRASKDDKTKTKQAQAVSKEVYERIQKAQELVDEENYPSALKILNNLYNPDKLSEYEQANVLNYLGYIYYNHLLQHGRYAEGDCDLRKTACNSESRATNGHADDIYDGTTVNR